MIGETVTLIFMSSFEPTLFASCILEAIETRIPRRSAQPDAVLRRYV